MQRNEFLLPPEEFSLRRVPPGWQTQRNFEVDKSSVHLVKKVGSIEKEAINATMASFDSAARMDSAVRYDEAANSNTTRRSNKMPAITLDGLESGQEYIFRVRAVGTAGPGPWSDVSIKRAP